MKLPKILRKGFTLIELLVVIAIIAILASLAVPAITGALLKGQLAQTVSNGKQIYLAGFQMAQDASVQGDANIGWPSNTNFTTAVSYVNKLMDYEYIKTTDVIKVFSAPGVTPWNGSNGTFAETNNAYKIYKVTDADGSSNVFACTKNYVYNTALQADSPTQPYGGKAFVVIRMGGDGTAFKRQQAQNVQNIGLLPGRKDFQSGTSETSADYLQ